jgi:hypothetical protein
MNIISRIKKLIVGNKKSNNAPIELDENSKLETNKTEIKEKSLEELYPNMTEEEIWPLVLEKDEDELTCEELSFNLGMTLHREHLYGRSLAIRELINNHYQVLPEENEKNQFKELINFTLVYFERYFADKPKDAEKLLRNSFPIMHLYIYRQISNGQNTITGDVQFDEQNAYDEFLFFCKNVFLSKYPDKSIRDEQIRRQFNITHNSLISFIE